MTRAIEERDLAHYLVDLGLNDCQIGRVMNVPRGTIRDWRRPTYVRKTATRGNAWCPICDGAVLDAEQYAYLLGLYLGDGWLTECARGVFKLRIALDKRYPGIIGECRRAIDVVRPRGAPANTASLEGCVEVYSSWKHWRCLFPQHGPGRKHLRPIVLSAWQEVLVAEHPYRLLRGLIHSDGWRGFNQVSGRAYPRYQFSNCSLDIQVIFIEACNRLGIEWRRSNWNTISVSRRASVARLDEFVGLKS